MKNRLKVLSLLWAIFLFTLNGIALKADFTFSSGCLGTPITLTSISSPPDSILAVLWDLDADGLFDDASGDTVVWSFPTLGNHPVGLQVISLNGSIDAIYKDVPVSGAQASFSYDAGCMGQPIQFTDLSIVLADSIVLRTWNFGDGSPSQDVKDPVHTYDETGTFKVTLFVITELGCQDSIQNEIVMQLPPEFTMSFSGDTASFHNDTIVAEVVGEYDSVIWNNTINNSQLIITQPGDYTVSVFRNDCFTSSSFTIYDHLEFQNGIMTLFTPNGDGYNDFWVINGMKSLGTCSVQVFDSWGSQVYSKDDYQNTWDGHSDNGELPSGPYYFVVRFANGQLFKGTVNILR